MIGGVPSLTDREKQTLRLLLAGHDAKSIARRLDLSVHTVNERLRDARRKLGVSSSREAARMLAEAEGGPQSLGDKPFGVGAADASGAGEPGQRRRTGSPLFWLSGGIVIMSLLIAAAALTLAVHPAAAPSSPPPPADVVSTRSVPIPASEWVSMLDRRAWDQSWDAAGTVFRSQMPKARWPATAAAVRDPLGPVSSRSVRSVTRTASLPGVPAGDYQLVEFATDFANKRGAVETVVLSREASGWRVNGYFVR